MAASTTRGLFPYPSPTDPDDVPLDLQRLADRIALTAALDGQGTLADRPAAGTRGSWFYATDTDTQYRDTGTAWEVVASTLTSPTTSDPTLSLNVAAGHTAAVLRVVTAGVPAFSVAADGSTTVGNTTGATKTNRVAAVDDTSTHLTLGATGAQFVSRTNAANTTLVVKAMGSQTGDLQSWQNSAGLVRMAVLADGTLRTGDSTNPTMRVAPGSTAAGTLGYTAAVDGILASTPALRVRGTSTQSANIFDVQTSAGAARFAVAANGQASSLGNPIPSSLIPSNVSVGTNGTVLRQLANTIVQTTDASGFLTVGFTASFSASVNMVIATPGDNVGNIGTVVTTTVTLSAATFLVLNRANGSPLANTTVRINYFAVGTNT